MVGEATSTADAGLSELRAWVAENRRGLLSYLPSLDGDCEGRADDPELCFARAGFSLGRRNARFHEEVILRLIERTGADGRGAGGVLLAGVGGFGRGALALRSDVDMRVLSTDVERAAAFFEPILYALWDLGIAVGHQVLTPDDFLESAKSDLTAATSLLDLRPIHGDRALCETLRNKAFESIFAQGEVGAFIGRLNQEVSERHARFLGSVYLLEPELKNAAGGLRDLDVVRWAVKARYGVGEIDEMVRVGALLSREAAELGKAADMLWSLRNLLHAHAGRRSDRLTFDEQEAIAELFGYGAGTEDVERMMSAYYRSARTVSQTLQRLLWRMTPVVRRLRPREEDLGGGVSLFDGHITMSDAERLKAEPVLCFRLVMAAVERGLPLLPHAREAIARAASDVGWAERLRESAEAAKLFVALCSSCTESHLHEGSVMRELHELGLLLAMIPEFRPVVGRVHHDIYHVYTVDVHSVAAVDRLTALVRGELASDFPLSCQLAAEIARPHVLFLATLLHDVGKAVFGSGHSERGAVMAETILRRLGFVEEDIAFACRLIRNHLVMYHVATRRDLDDPAAIDEFLRDTQGPAGLADLYLLTIVDLSTTSPGSLTSWKLRMLDELYLAANRADRRAQREDLRRASVCADVMALVGGAGQSGAIEFTRAYLQSMPDRYLLSNAPASIAAHAEIARSLGSEAATVALVPSSRRGAAEEMCVIAKDRPGLLAAITASIAASRLEVLGAQIHTRVHEGDTEVQAVDLFWVRDRADDPEGVARAVPKLKRDLSAMLSGALDAHELAKKRLRSSAGRRRAPKVRTQISIDNRTSPVHTVIEVITQDRPWLLFTIADAFYRLGLNISVAKVNTEGARVADVFYVSEVSGAKVEAGKRSAEIETYLLEALSALERGGSGT